VPRLRDRWLVRRQTSAAEALHQWGFQQARRQLLSATPHRQQQLWQLPLLRA